MAVKDELGKIVEANMMVIYADDDTTKLAQLDFLGVLERIDVIEECFDVKFYMAYISKKRIISAVMRIICVSGKRN